jgi:hypothetical protein
MLIGCSSRRFRKNSFETTRVRELAELEAREIAGCSSSGYFSCPWLRARGIRGVSQGGAVLSKRKASIATQQR